MSGFPQMYEIWTVQDGIESFTGQLIPEPALPPNLVWTGTTYRSAKFTQGEQEFNFVRHVESLVIDAEWEPIATSNVVHCPLTPVGGSGIISPS